MDSVLYHPNIEFQDKDYQWLIRASLFWDHIYRIVPEEYTPQDNDKIKILSNEGVIKKIEVKKDNWELDNLRHSASNEFLRDYRKIMGSYNLKNPDWKNDITRFNISKADYALLEHLDELGLVIKPESEHLWQNKWLYIPKYLGDRYMSYFARHIANDNGNIALGTPDSESWLSASNLLNRQDYGNEIETTFFPVCINDIIPENLDIPLKKLIKFRKKTEG